MIALMKDAHDGMSDGFRKLLESPGYSIYYHAPTVIMVIGKIRQPVPGDRLLALR